MLSSLGVQLGLLTPLQCAVVLKSKEALALLLANGADPDMLDFVRMPTSTLITFCCCRPLL